MYAAKCLACHGAKGAGKPADALVGGMGTLASETPAAHGRQLLAVRDDAVRLHAPRDADANPLSLSNDEVYAVTAYVLLPERHRAARTRG